jgi:hypothetical protein
LKPSRSGQFKSASNYSAHILTSGGCPIS